MSDVLKTPERADLIHKLRAARALIENRWIKHKESDGLGGYCLIGALYQVGIHHCREVKHEGFRGHRDSIPGWNDQPERIKEEILTCIDNTIELLCKGVRPEKGPLLYMKETIG